MASEVEIHLPIQGTTKWIHAFTIPSEDIKRFTLRPLKWLRFATFAVCGAKGHLSTTERNDGIVNYQNTTFNDLANKYFYIPDNQYHFVDFKVINGRLTSTPRRSRFRDEIKRRDVECVITGAPLLNCDAAHIIPKGKGDNYLSFILRDRSSLYDGPLPSLQEGINSIENGMLLRADLHSMFDHAQIGFLKTPNFAMLPADVPQVVQGPIPDNRTTLQYFELLTGRGAIPQWDVQVDWFDNELQPPPSILLDFMYGAAVVKHWKSDSLLAKLEEYFQTDFRPVLAKKNSPPSTPHLDDDESGVESDDDDPEDPDWGPSSEEEVRETFTEVASADLLRTMDHMRFLPMLLKGIPPEEVAAELERQNKEAELRDQNRSREKVRQWLDFSPVS